MPKSNKIWTLRDLTDNQEETYPALKNTDSEQRVANATGTSSVPHTAVKGGSPSILKCCHIPTLPSAEQAKALLERVVREFEPIAQQRGYNILSVSEFCCCNDGLDFEPHRKRKIRKAANNLWGYNQTTWAGRSKAHSIHLRLRHAQSHSRFHEYEDVAGTMAHELAHCEHGPHNDKFYKLMDDILDQHAGLMASKLSSNGYSMPAFGGTGQVLGENAENKTLAQIRGQQQLSQQHGGYKLGGDNAFSQWMTPVEASVAAAEARRRQQQLRLRGDHCCRPCTITIDDDGDEQEVTNDLEEDRKMLAQPLGQSRSNQNREGRKRPIGGIADAREDENRKSPAKRNVEKELDQAPFIDLTGGDEDDTAATHEETKSTGSPNLQWSCLACTFLNQPLALACSLCRSERDLTAWSKSPVYLVE